MSRSPGFRKNQTRRGHESFDQRQTDRHGARSFSRQTARTHTLSLSLSTSAATWCLARLQVWRLSGRDTHVEGACRCLACPDLSTRVAVLVSCGRASERRAAGGGWVHVLARGFRGVGVHALLPGARGTVNSLPGRRRPRPWRQLWLLAHRLTDLIPTRMNRLLHKTTTEGRGCRGAYFSSSGARSRRVVACTLGALPALRVCYTQPPQKDARDGSAAVVLSGTSTKTLALSLAALCHGSRGIARRRIHARGTRTEVSHTREHSR